MFTMVQLFGEVSSWFLLVLPSLRLWCLSLPPYHSSSISGADEWSRLLEGERVWHIRVVTYSYNKQPKNLIRVYLNKCLSSFTKSIPNIP